MQVTMDINSANLGRTVEQVFEGLTKKERKDLARSVMLEVLSTPMGAEREAYERKVIDGLIEKYKNDSYPPDRITTEEAARNNYRFRQEMSKFKSSSDRMMEEITKSAIENYKELITDLVKNDEQLNTAYAIIREQLVANFPQIVQSAMAAHFASQMGQISNLLTNQFTQTQNLNNLGAVIQAQLANNGINIVVPIQQY